MFSRAWILGDETKEWRFWNCGIRNAKVTEDISTHGECLHICKGLFDGRGKTPVQCLQKVSGCYIIISTYKMRASMLSIKPVWQEWVGWGIGV